MITAMSRSHNSPTQPSMNTSLDECLEHLLDFTFSCVATSKVSNSASSLCSDFPRPFLISICSCLLDQAKEGTHRKYLASDHHRNDWAERFADLCFMYLDLRGHSIPVLKLGEILDRLFQYADHVPSYSDYATLDTDHTCQLSNQGQITSLSTGTGPGPLKVNSKDATELQRHINDGQEWVEGQFGQLQSRLVSIAELRSQDRQEARRLAQFLNTLSNRLSTVEMEFQSQYHRSTIVHQCMTAQMRNLLTDRERAGADVTLHLTSTYDNLNSAQRSISTTLSSLEATLQSVEGTIELVQQSMEHMIHPADVVSEDIKIPLSIELTQGAISKLQESLVNTETKIASEIKTLLAVLLECRSNSKEILARTRCEDNIQGRLDQLLALTTDHHRFVDQEMKLATKKAETNIVYFDGKVKNLECINSALDGRFVILLHQLQRTYSQHKSKHAYYITVFIISIVTSLLSFYILHVLNRRWFSPAYPVWGGHRFEDCI